MPPGRKTKEGDKKEVLANRYQKEKKLGSGNFGTAFLVKDLKKGGELKVLKEIPVGDLQPDETVDAMSEARLLSKLDHPGIVKFHDSFLDGEYCCIVCEYCEGGDLDQKITKYKKEGKHFEEIQVIEWILQFLLAVNHMHSRRVLHRDLKARNIFLKNNMIKIGDFGISRILMGTVDMASTFTGTPYYMSPEVLKHEGYNSKSDIWSVGCILYELCTLQHAFEGQSLMGVMYKIVEGDCPELPDRYSKQLGEVLKKLLTKDPEKRPSAHDMLQIPFMSRHLEKMKDSYLGKRNIKEETIVCKKEAQEIATLLREKSCLKTLQQEEEEIKYKNMSPRERMRLRKMQEADAKAKKIREVASANFLANQTRKQTRLEITQARQKVPWAQAQGRGRGQGAASQSLGPKSTMMQQDIRPKTTEYSRRVPEYAAHEDYDDHHLSHSLGYERNSDPYSDDYHEHTIVHQDDDDIVYSKPGYGEPEYSDENEHTLVERTLVARPPLHHTLNVGGGDDRPITPLKDKMIYDVAHSSLDFRDGIPDDPKLAETYYEQYDDFEENPDGDDDGFGEGTLGDDDELQLINYMENALASDDAGRTQTFADDTVSGAFGPAARDIKIKNLRAECEKKMGKADFQKAYNYLKKARGDKKKPADEGTIHKTLKSLVKNPYDCFYVDQLLFLEEQASLGT